MDQHDRIARVIREYDAQGWHRAGTQVDHGSALWLAEQLRQRGLDPQLQPFDLDRVDPQPSYVEIVNRRVDGLPLFDSGFTDADGVSGALGPVSSGSAVGLAETGRGGQNEAALSARRSGEHRAIVAVTLGGRPGLAATNALSFSAPYGPPVLQVSSDVGPWLREHAERGSNVHVVAAATRTRAQTHNVVARLEGRRTDLRPVVVMTPRSGWWHCAGERGGGIAGWLEIAQAIWEAVPARDVLFVATGAHELGVAGIDALLGTEPSLAASALAWVHLGASIGAAQEPAPRFSATDDDLERRMTTALERAGADPVPAAPRGTTVGGESQAVVAAGGRCVVMAGGNALFHMESDRWPEAVDVAAVARYANAFTEVAVGLAMDEAAA